MIARRSFIMAVLIVGLVALTGFAQCDTESEILFSKPEILFVDGVPLHANVRPVIVLSGTDYEMGYQYAQQIAQIFGPWLLDRWILTNAWGSRLREQSEHRHFTAEELNALKAYQWYLRKYTPEMIDFIKGLAAGATDAGTPLTYEEAMVQFTSAKVLEEFLPAEAESEQLPPAEDNCSSFAAWGSATKDGKLIAAGSSDGSDYLAATVVFLPDEGNSFIWCIYEAVGGYFGAGAGQPAMNDKGLLYVHHGQTPKAAQVGKVERYGLQVGPAIWHTLRFADNVEEAVDMYLGFPTTGGGWGYAGGFWADTGGNAVVIESKEDPLVIRKPGDLGEVDFMYATNTCLSEEMGREGQVYVPQAGWTTEGRAPSTSIGRNLELWHMLTDYHGQVDLEFTKMMWRYPGTPVPIESTPDAWAEEATAHYEENVSAWGHVIGRQSVADIGICIPDKGLFYVCNGYASDAPNIGSPRSVGGGRYQPFATRAFYQLKLASTPKEVAKAAESQAKIDLFFANRELRKLTYSDPAYAPLDAIYNQALIEWTKGDYLIGGSYGLVNCVPADEAIYCWAKATRAFCRSQALARQVYNALVPQASRPEDLGLAPYTYGNLEE